MFNVYHGLTTVAPLTTNVTQSGRFVKCVMHGYLVNSVEVKSVYLGRFMRFNTTEVIQKPIFFLQ